MLEPHLAPCHHLRPLLDLLTWPHLHVSDAGLRLDWTLWPQEDSTHRHTRLVRRPGLDSVPHCLLHPRLARLLRSDLTRSDDVVSLAPRVLTTDNEGPHSLATARDHLRHLLLTLRLSPHHLDTPGDTGSDNYLASTRCLLPHSGPLSDLTSLQPRSLLH